MPTPPVPFSEIKHTVELWHQALDDGYPVKGSNATLGALRVTLDQLGLNGSTTSAVTSRLDTAVALGIPVRSWRAVDPQWASSQVLRYRRLDDDFQAAEQQFGVTPSASRSPSRGVRAARGSSASRKPLVEAASPARVSPSKLEQATRAYHSAKTHAEEREAYTQMRAAGAPASFGEDEKPKPTAHDIIDQVVPVLRRGPLSLEQLSARLGVEPVVAGMAIEIAHSRGASIHQRGELWHLDNAPAMGSQQEHEFQLVARDNTIEFAAVGDTHLGSKYAREDCLSDFYDEVARRQIPIVLHAGNWIDGEASFNKHDLTVHGMDNQMRYLAENYPRRDGVETWAITGEDHEGWYSRREGVDVGRYAENAMRQHDRTDWRNLGFMETFIPLVCGGSSTQLCLMHPGGGSAYAISYQPQKIVESFDGGDKPAVLLLGHYHKASYNLIRNVHTLQVGCFQDQSLFMRKLKIAAHLAGVFVKLRLDPETAAVIECQVSFRNYFVRDYYRGRWSQHGPVEHAPRTP